MTGKTILHNKALQICGAHIYKPKHQIHFSLQKFQHSHCLKLTEVEARMASRERLSPWIQRHQEGWGEGDHYQQHEEVGEEGEGEGDHYQQKQ